MSSITRLEDRVEIYPRREQRRAEELEFETKVPYQIEKEDIPQDPQEFVEDFGGIGEHQRTGERVGSSDGAAQRSVPVPAKNDADAPVQRGKVWENS